MIKKLCLNCKKEFETYYSKFCSRKCYWETGRGSNTKTHTEKSLKGLLEYYKSEKGKEEKKIRNKKISDSHKVYYNDAEINLLRTYLEAGYIRNKRTLNAKITNRVSYKALINTLKLYPELNSLYLKNIGELPSIIQNMSLEEWEQFKYNFAKYNVTEFCEKFNFSPKSHLRIRKLLNIYPNRYWRLNETKPEKIIEELLIKYNIAYEKQVKLGKYIADFKIGKIIIEIQGDYWHGNPKFYSEENLNNMQKKHKIRDIFKKEYYLNSGYFLIEIWENEINKKIEKIEKLIKIIKNGRFNREFYSTSSWKK